MAGIPKSNVGMIVVMIVDEDDVDSDDNSKRMRRMIVMRMTDAEHIPYCLWKQRSPVVSIA